jgi:hypothetical protein
MREVKKRFLTFVSMVCLMHDVCAMQIEKPQDANELLKELNTHRSERAQPVNKWQEEITKLKEKVSLLDNQLVERDVAISVLMLKLKQLDPKFDEKQYKHGVVSVAALKVLLQTTQNEVDKARGELLEEKSKRVDVMRTQVMDMSEIIDNPKTLKTRNGQIVCSVTINILLFGLVIYLYTRPVNVNPLIGK